MNVSGDASFNGKLNVSGDASFNGSLNVSDTVSCNSLSVSDNGSFGGTLNVSGDASFNGNVLITEQNSLYFFQNPSPDYVPQYFITTETDKQLGIFGTSKNGIGFYANPSSASDINVDSYTMKIFYSDSCGNSVDISNNLTVGGYYENPSTTWGTITCPGTITTGNLSVGTSNYGPGGITASGNLSIAGSASFGNTYLLGEIIYMTTDQTGVDIFTDLTVSGKVTAGSFNSTSDYRLKENIREFSLDEYSLDHLRPVEYNFKTHSSENKSIGFIAHEVQEHLPSLVNGERDGEEMQSIKQLEMTSLLVKEIQELKKRLNKIENQLI